MCIVTTMIGTRSYPGQHINIDTSYCQNERKRKRGLLLHFYNTLKGTEQKNKEMSYKFEEY